GVSADDDAGGVVEEYLRADLGGRMDADLQPFRRGALHQQRKVAAALLPEPAGDAPRPKRKPPLVVEQRWQQSGGRRIVLDDALQIAAGGVDKLGRCRQNFAGDARKPRTFVVFGAEALADLVGERLAEAGMRKDGVVQRGPENVIAACGALGFAADRAPESLR